MTFRTKRKIAIIVFVSPLLFIFPVMNIVSTIDWSLSKSEPATVIESTLEATASSLGRAGNRTVVKLDRTLPNGKDSDSFTTSQRYEPGERIDVRVNKRTQRVQSNPFTVDLASWAISVALVAGIVWWLRSDWRS